MSEYPTAPEGSSVANIIDSLSKAGSEYAGSVSGHSGKWTCPNPGHDDSNASFDVTVGSNGKAVFNCSPCLSSGDRDEWIAALRAAGVEWSGEACKPEDVDWGPAAEVVSKGTAKDHGPEVGRDVYTYRFKSGKVNFQVARVNYEDGAKRFIARHTDKQGKTSYSLPEGVIRTPLNLERFETWADKPVYLVEGEKACKALNDQKVRATTFHGGTNAPMHPRWTEWFQGFQRVLVWPDADEVGIEFAKERALELRAAGIEVLLVGDPEAKASDDAYDALQRGPAAQVTQVLTKGDLKRLAALKPKPVVSSTGATSLGEFNGKQIVNAPQIGAAIDAKKPYGVAHTIAPFRFAREVVSREFVDASDAMVLRWNPAEQQFWFWSEAAGYYRPLMADEIRALVEQRLDGKREQGPDGSRPIVFKDKGLNEVIKGLVNATLVSEHGAGTLLAAVNGVPFRNGWLDASSGLLTPLGPERDVRWVVPAEYDESASCPEWLKFLKSLGFSDSTEEHRLLAQWFGYLLSGRIDLSKGLLLVGPKRSGKGTILKVAEAIMGDGAVATSLEAFSRQNRFGLINLVGKGLGVMGDARWGGNDTGRNSAILEWTGGDSKEVEGKFKNAFTITPTARLMIASNETPRFYEASDALATRFLMIEFTKSFYGHEDLDLKNRLLRELPGIAKWALDGLADLNSGDGRFDETQKGLAMQEQLMKDAAPVRKFVEDNCVVDSGAFVETQELWDAYRLWRENQGLNKCTISDFGRELKAAFPDSIEDYRARVSGKRVNCKRGLRLDL